MQHALDGMLKRRLLTRDFGEGQGTVLFVMLNPSTATQTHSDPTIRRCEGFAKRWGYRTLEVVNLFAWRATVPKYCPRTWDEEDDRAMEERRQKLMQGFFDISERG